MERQLGVGSNANGGNKKKKDKNGKAAKELTNWEEDEAQLKSLEDMLLDAGVLDFKPDIESFRDFDEDEDSIRGL